MNHQWKTFLMRVLYPPMWLLVLLALVAFPMMIVSLVMWNGEGVVSYISFALAFYSLVTISVRVPDIIRFCRDFKANNPIAVRYFSDVTLRADISLWGGLLYGGVYTVLQLCLGIVHSSFWYYTLAFYYLILVCMRFYLVRKLRSFDPEHPTETEWHIYRMIGILLVCLALVLQGMVFFIVYFGRTFHHHQITTIALAAYTFTNLTLAIVNVVRYRKYQSPLLSSLKAVGLVSAMVSMLTLECAMLTAFDEGAGELFRQIMTGATGGAVVVLTLLISVFMIVKSNQKLNFNKTLTQEKTEENNTSI